MDAIVSLFGNERVVSDENLRAFVLGECFDLLSREQGRVFFERRGGQVDVLWRQGRNDRGIPERQHLGHVRPLNGGGEDHVHNIFCWLAVEFPDEAGLLREV